MAEKNLTSNVFRNKNFSLLFGGVLVSNIAHILFNFAISLYILEITASAFSKETAAMVQAIYLAVSGIILVILMPFGGVLADKFNKVRTMYITDYIRGITIILVGIFLIFDPSYLTKIIALFAMNIILSINSSFFSPASSSLLRFIVKDENLQPAAAYLQGSYGIQTIAGLILGGILYASVPIFWIFIINGVAYLLSAISEMFIRYNASEHTSKTTGLKSVIKDIGDGLKYIISQKAIFTILIMALALNFFLSPLFANALPYFIKFNLAESGSYLFDGFLEPANWYSIMSVAISVSAIIMSLILSSQKTKEKYGKSLKIAISCFVIITAFLSLTMILYYQGIFSINFVLVSTTLFLFLLGFANTSFNVPVGLIFQRNVEKNQLGKVSSVSSVLSQALVPISSLVAGVLISQISISAVYVFSLIGMIVVTLFYLYNKNADDV